MKFQLVTDPINEYELKQELAHSQAGGFASFEGWVRDHNDGKSVDSLEYEAFKELCDTEAEVIAQEAMEKYRVIDVKCVHRVGHLKVGEMAVWIGVTAAHRGPAFEACQYLIDELKVRLPIWKKEHYRSGVSEWIDCQQCYQRSRKRKQSAQKERCENHVSQLPKLEDEKLFYSRQTILKDVGEVGQQKLRSSRVLVIGAGGLGAPVIQTLAATGIGQLGICDFDCLDITNLHRQLIYRYDQVGKAKSVLAADFARALNPFITVKSYQEKLTFENIFEIAKDYDYLLDCSDNFPTKFLISDYGYQNNKVVIQGSIYQMEGQVQAFYSGNENGCMRCLWEVEPEPGCIGSCAEAGVLGVVPAIVGHTQALEVIRSILSDKKSLSNETTLIDLNTMQSLKLIREKKKGCLVCGSISKKSVAQKKLLEKLHQEHCRQRWELDRNEYQLNQYQCIDIRETDELPRLPGRVISMPLSQFDPAKLDRNSPTLLVCQKGLRSRKKVSELRKMGYDQVFSLLGGCDKGEWPLQP